VTLTEKLFTADHTWFTWNTWENSKHKPAEKLVPSRAKNGRTVVWYQTNVSLQQVRKHLYKHSTIYQNTSLQNVSTQQPNTL